MGPPPSNEPPKYVILRAVGGEIGAASALAPSTAAVDHAPSAAEPTRTSASTVRGGYHVSSSTTRIRARRNLSRSCSFCRCKRIEQRGVRTRLQPSGERKRFTILLDGSNLGSSFHESIDEKDSRLRVFRPFSFVKKGYQFILKKSLTL